jgi:23S rRNA pseudouridine1911/1915/1917 synthase
MRLLELTAGEAEASLPLHSLLRERLGMPRRLLRRLWSEAAILQDGIPAQPWHRAKTGSRIEVCWPGTPDLPAAAPDVPLSIVYEDYDILVVDKAAGIVCHPTHGVASGTLADALVHRYGAAHLVQRLDRDTSGLLLAARHPWSAAILGQAMARRDIRRTYAALVPGCRQAWPDLIDAPIGRDPESGNRRVDPVEGQEARTRILASVAQEEAGITWLVLALETGRTHQIRVHLAHLGHPILGDGRYGPPGAPGRMVLHAHHLTFRHPRTGQRMAVEATWPADLPTMPHGLYRRLADA